MENAPLPDPEADEPSLRVRVQLPEAITFPVILVLVLLLQTEIEAEVRVAEGRVFTVIGLLVLLQPVAVSVNVKSEVPAERPVTNPALVIDASNGLLLTHVPPDAGVAFTVLPMQTEDGTDNTGRSW